MTFRSFSFLLLTALGTSQQKPAATIDGLVLDAHTGAPIKRAQVWLDRLKVMEAGALTGSDGRFVLENVVPGRYSLSAHHSRYLRQNYGAKRAGGRGTQLTIAPGQRQKNIEIRFWRPALVTGHVVDEDGRIEVSGLCEDFYLKEESGIQVDSDDIDGIELVVSPLGGTIDGTVLDSSNNPVYEAKVILSPETKSKSVPTAWTDQNGRYSIRGVRPGKYRLLAWDSDKAARHDSMSLSNSETKLGKEIAIEESSGQTVELILEDVQ